MIKSLRLTQKISISVLFSLINISAFFTELNNTAYKVVDDLVYNSGVFIEYSLTEDFNILYYAGSEVGLGGVYNIRSLSKGNALFSFSPGVVMKYRIYDWHSERPFKISLDKIKIHLNVFHFSYMLKNCRINIISGMVFVKTDDNWKLPFSLQFCIDREVIVDGCRLGALYG